MMVLERRQARQGLSAITAALTVLVTGCPGEASDDGTGGGAGPTTNADGTGSSPTGNGAETTTPDEPTGGGGSEPGTGDPPGTTAAASADSGSGSESGDGGSSESTGVPGDAGPDLRQMGPFTVESMTGQAALPDCSMSYEWFTPMGVDDAPAVVLSHGFQGNRGSMIGWAQHWASWGVQVITPNLCHATIIDTDHPQNGADLQALVDDLALGAVIYAGYSAGGLASMIATAGDPDVIALVGLDMVDANDLGANAAGDVDVPAFNIIGEPSMCNTSNNGLAVFQAAGGQILRVTEADHCDFMSPADVLCGFTCMGGNNQFDDAAIADAVRGLSTAAVLWQAGVEPTGAQWWTPGEPYFEELAGTGILQQP